MLKFSSAGRGVGTIFVEFLVGWRIGIGGSCLNCDYCDLNNGP